MRRHQSPVTVQCADRPSSYCSSVRQFVSWCSIFPAGGLAWLDSRN